MTMNDIAIRVDNVSKLYRLGQSESFHSLRDSFNQALTTALSRLGKADQAERKQLPQTIWALKDVSLEIQHGDAIGIIGRNGAGKSTLLKILSRITRPTRGCAEVRGRIGSLLEVGTGFHPDLTGRENVFLNGAILGMRRTEIQRKFDEIVSFAELEDFIDTPVKRYSSGMYTRLAFAVAAHLETEILLVDEVLAVGDIAFQQKCLRVMGQMGHAGRTVVFVSHNLPAIESLCKTSYLIDNGKLAAVGPTREIIGQYLNNTFPEPSMAAELRDHPGRRVGSIPIMRSIELEFKPGRNPNQPNAMFGQDISLTVRYQSERRFSRPVLGFTIKNRFGVNILGMDNRIFGVYPQHQAASSGKITGCIQSFPLTEGRYVIDLWFGDGYQDFDVIENAISFDILPAEDPFGTGRMPDQESGVVYWPVRWEFKVDE